MLDRFWRLLAWVWTHPLLSDRARSALMWWLNAKFAAGVTAVIHDDTGRVLLLEHAFRRHSRWALPGGWMTRTEQPEAAIVREVREETGLDIRVERLLTARTFRLPRLDIVYVCSVIGGVQCASFETPRWRWCSPDSYPPDVDRYSVEMVQRAACAQ